MINQYLNNKEIARSKALDFQNTFSENGESYSYMQLAKAMQGFEVLAKRYGLTKEFKENGII